MEIKKKTLEDTVRFTEMVAKKQGWVLSKDTEFYNDLVSGLTTNWNRYGYYLCPCRDTGGSRAADEDIQCPCVYARADLSEYGHCFCSLFWSKEFAASGKKPGGIPERRPID